MWYKSVLVLVCMDCYHPLYVKTHEVYCTLYILCLPRWLIVSTLDIMFLFDGCQIYASFKSGMHLLFRWKPLPILEENEWVVFVTAFMWIFWWDRENWNGRAYAHNYQQIGRYINLPLAYSTIHLIFKLHAIIAVKLWTYHRSFRHEDKRYEFYYAAEEVE